MKKITKFMSISLFIFALCLLGTISLKTEAATAKVSYYSDSKTCYIAIDGYDGYYQARLLCNGKQYKLSDVSTYVAIYNVTPGRVYTYQVRGVNRSYDSNYNTVYTYGNWSKQFAFATAKKAPSMKTKYYKRGDNKSYVLKVPKIQGVKKFNVYYKKVGTKSWKKVKAIKPGKSYRYTKFGKKKFKLGTMYDCKVVPVLSNKMSCYNYWTF